MHSHSVTSVSETNAPYNNTYIECDYNLGGIISRTEIIHKRVPLISRSLYVFESRIAFRTFTLFAATAPCFIRDSIFYQLFFSFFCLVLLDHLRFSSSVFIVVGRRAHTNAGTTHKETKNKSEKVYLLPLPSSAQSFSRVVAANSSSIKHTRLIRVLEIFV